MCTSLVSRCYSLSLSFSIQPGPVEVFLGGVRRAGHKIEVIVFLVDQLYLHHIIITLGDEGFFFTVPAYPVDMAPAVFFGYPEEVFPAIDPVPACDHPVLPGALAFDISAVFFVVDGPGRSCGD